MFKLSKLKIVKNWKWGIGFLFLFINFQEVTYALDYNLLHRDFIVTKSKENNLDDEKTRFTRQSVKIYEVNSLNVHWKFQAINFQIPKNTIVQLLEKYYFWGEEYYEIKTKTLDSTPQNRYFLKANDLNTKFYPLNKDQLSNKEYYELSNESANRIAGIDKLDKNILDLYMQDGYSVFNDYLRTGNLPSDMEKKVHLDDGKLITDENIAEYTKRLSQIINKYKTTWNKDVILYRGTSLELFYGLKLFGSKDDYPHIGDVISDKGFLSTSMSKEVAQAFLSKEQFQGQRGALFVIHIQKGESIGVLVDNQLLNRDLKMSQVQSDENLLFSEKECLLPPETLFVVIGFEEDNGVKVVHLKTMNSMAYSSSA